MKISKIISVIAIIQSVGLILLSILYPSDFVDVFNYQRHRVWHDAGDRARHTAAV